MTHSIQGWCEEDTEGTVRRKEEHVQCVFDNATLQMYDGPDGTSGKRFAVYESPKPGSKRLVDDFYAEKFDGNVLHNAGPTSWTDEPSRIRAEGRKIVIED